MRKCILPGKLSKSIDPCKIDWKLLESREFRNRQGSEFEGNEENIKRWKILALEIEYTVRTEVSKEAGEQSGKNVQSGSSKGTESSGGGGLGIPQIFSAEVRQKYFKK